MDELSRFRAEEEKRIALLRDWPTSGDKAARYGAPNCGSTARCGPPSPLTPVAPLAPMAAEGASAVEILEAILAGLAAI